MSKQPTPEDMAKDIALLQQMEEIFTIPEDLPKGLINAHPKRKVLVTKPKQPEGNLFV